MVIRNTAGLVLVRRTIRGIGLDLEGTTVDLEDKHFKAFADATTALGYPLTPTQILALPYAIGGGDQRVSESIEQLSEGQLSATELRKLKSERFDELIETDSMKPRVGFLRVFHELSLRGLPVAIGSLTSRKQARLILERSGLDSLIDYERVVLLEDVANKKPAPDVFIETARRMGIDPSEQLVFEDSRTGVEAGVSAGSQTVALPIYRTPANIETLLTAGASHVYDGWDDIDLSELLD